MDAQKMALRCVEATLAAARQQIALAADAADGDEELVAAWVALRRQLEALEYRGDGQPSPCAAIRRIIRRREQP